ncbi:sugar porter family MFS transporter [Mucilaginibacter agri]|uniref:Sugar porter family MFS transporter n=1 Tax=Mucilaginibacter agri TaxID=2695265 RepID=A0A966DV59_9SPHI|nr:sugar porter family MFS transporter [Mucilaginibacter agri]NCD72520.1 sugar porter family MFS transporter [Mucilaginibacter agri]
MSSIPQARRVNYICIAAALGGLLFGFDTAVISGAESFLKTQFQLSTTMEGWLVSCGLLGCIIGVFATGAISDRIGRKKTILIAAVVFLASGIGCAFAPSLNVLIVSRLLGGVGVGMASVISPMYIAEFAPAAKRGQMVAYYQMAITVGILLAYLSNALVLQVAKQDTGSGAFHWLFSTEAWRAMFLIMCVPSLCFLLALWTVPESPRWLVSVNKSHEAARILNFIRTPEEADKELSDISKAKKRSSSTSLFPIEKALRVPLLIGVVLAVLQQFSGINAIIYYGPRIFETVGIPSSNALLFQVIIGAINVIFTLVAISYADKYGRKSLLKYGLTGIVLSLISCGLLFYTGNTQGYLLLVLILVYIACFAFSVGPVTWIIINEIFPTNVRVKAVSLCTLALWGAVWMVGQFFPWLLDKAGAAITFWAFAAFSLINFIFSLTVVKETNGKTLEEMDEVYIAPH